MTFVVIFTYKVVSQVILQHRVADASTCTSALQIMRYSYMPLGMRPQACEYHYKDHKSHKSVVTHDLPIIHSILIFILNSAYAIIFFLDANECELGTAACDQNCHNTNGSYTCSCNAGYTLDSDRTSCDGMCVYLLP